MAGRNTRALIAKQTVQIVERGEYSLADGSTVSIAGAVKSAVAGTVHYAPQDFAGVFEKRDAILADAVKEDNTQYRVVNTTTLAAARDLLGGDSRERVLGLNFASAKNPGGGFLRGSQAQEESLARASALYACINPKRAYYEANRACGTCLYTDQMIYSPAVPVFRGQDDELLTSPYKVSMITAPAVNAGAVRQNEPSNAAKIDGVMRGRIEKVLSLAVLHGYKTLVLGAWGCGVFKNAPADIARQFCRHLRECDPFAGFFDTVVFAVLDRTRNLDIIRPFQERFASPGD
jgi:uncharacterized protein (TIGR02452 family)